MSEPAERISAYGAGGTATAFEGFANSLSGLARAQRPGQQKQDGKDASQQFAGLVKNGNNGDSLSLSPEAKEQLRKLKQRDAEVRAHEAAHLAAAGQYASGGPQFEYQQGPDGRQYAIGGHVDIDVSSVPGDPEATEEKAEQVRRAAMAPGSPSAQDSKVAASAARMAAQAKIDKSQEKAEEAEDGLSGAGEVNGELSGKTADRAARAYSRVGSFFAGNSMTADMNQASQYGNPQAGMTQGIQAYSMSALSGALPEGYSRRGAILAMAV